MKTNSQSLVRVARKMGGLLGMVMVFLSAKSALGATSADPSNGSSLTWDCVETGKNEAGIAMLTFSGAGGLTGYEINVARTLGSSEGGVRVTGDGGRVETDGTNSSHSSISGF